MASNMLSFIPNSIPNVPSSANGMGNPLFGTPTDQGLIVQNATCRHEALVANQAWRGNGVFSEILPSYMRLTDPPASDDACRMERGYVVFNPNNSYSPEQQPTAFVHLGCAAITDRCATEADVQEQFFRNNTILGTCIETVHFSHGIPVNGNDPVAVISGLTGIRNTGLRRIPPRSWIMCRVPKAVVDDCLARNMAYGGGNSLSSNPKRPRAGDGGDGGGGDNGMSRAIENTSSMKNNVYKGLETYHLDPSNMDPEEVVGVVRLQKLMEFPRMQECLAAWYMMKTILDSDDPSSVTLDQLNVEKARCRFTPSTIQEKLSRVRPEVLQGITMSVVPCAATIVGQFTCQMAGLSVEAINPGELNSAMINMPTASLVSKLAE